MEADAETATETSVEFDKIAVSEAPSSLTELFERDCPYYLSIGMTYEQYWYGDVWMVKAYRNADLQKQKRHNSEAWLQGMYFWEAITKSLANFASKKGTKPQEYSAEPYDLFGDKLIADKEEREKQEALRADLYMKQFERMGQNWGKEQQ